MDVILLAYEFFFLNCFRRKLEVRLLQNSYVRNISIPIDILHNIYGYSYARKVCFRRTPAADYHCPKTAVVLTVDVIGYFVNS